MEETILKQLPDLTIQQMVCYEPGEEQFKHLSKINFGLKKESVLHHHEAFTEKSDLNGTKFDVITMFHVHYYWTDLEQRKLVMQHLFNHLIKDGLLIVLILNEGHSNQVDLRRVTKNKLKFAKARHYNSMTLYGNDVFKKEIKPLLSEDLKEFQDQHNYEVSLDFDLSDKNYDNETMQLINYVTSVRFQSLDQEMSDFVFKWIKENFQHLNGDKYRMKQSVSLMIYTRLSISNA